MAQTKDILEKALPSGRVFFDFSEWHDYTRDAAEIIHVPEALFFAESEADVIFAVRVCREHDIPVIFRGAGTGYTGGAVAVEGGLMLSVERMKEIHIDADAKSAIVGPGAITGDILDKAAEHGLFYPPDPASYRESTIGGNLAENAGGLRCKKYGVTKDYIISARGVNADGNFVEVDNMSPFGLCDVLIGSEGTLFAFTEITLRLIDLPRPGKTILATFDDSVKAARVVADIMATGIIPSIMEFMDGDAIACTNEFDSANKIQDCEALLLIETDGVHGNDEAVRIEEICNRHAPALLRLTTDKAESERLWLTRRNLSNAVKSSAAVKTAEDVCVPPSRLPELVEFVKELHDTLGIRVNCYGHAGDGNLHVNFLLSEDTEAGRAIAERGVSELFDRTLALNGTLTGEHGIGITKKEFLRWEFDEDTLRFMMRLKRSLDTGGVFNPGKIFSE
ncbi:MAG: FAD-linked oxidase C-terminal domain-containing protein [Candidatus Zixiibacteriota bacterium]